jgi:hypothetical protein
MLPLWPAPENALLLQTGPARRMADLIESDRPFGFLCLPIALNLECRLI